MAFVLTVLALVCQCALLGNSAYDDEHSALLQAGIKNHVGGAEFGNSSKRKATYWNMIGKGYCEDGPGKYPDYYNKEPVTDEECRSQCETDGDCVGYDFQASRKKCDVYVKGKTSTPVGWSSLRTGKGGSQDVSSVYMANGITCYKKTQTRAEPCACAEPWTNDPDDGNWCYLAKGRKKTTCALSDRTIVKDWAWARCRMQSGDYGQNIKRGVHCYQGNWNQKNGLTPASWHNHQLTVMCRNSANDIGNVDSVSDGWHDCTYLDDPSCRYATTLRVKSTSYNKCIFGDLMMPLWEEMCTYYWNWKDNDVGKFGSSPWKIVNTPGYDCDAF